MNFKTIKTVVSAVFTLGVFVTAFVFWMWGDDMIQAVTEGGEGHAQVQTAEVFDNEEGQTRMRVTLVVNSVRPEGGELTLSAYGPGILADRVWTWEEIVAGSGQPDLTLSPGQTITTELDIHLFGLASVQEGAQPAFTLTTYWADAKQHGYVIGLGHLYE